MKLSHAGESSRRSSVNIGSRFEAIGSLVLRYGLVLVIGWTNGIQPLVAHSPLLSWMYGLLTVEQFSKGLGTVEVMIAVLIGLRHWSAKASALGSGFAVLMFLTTLSFVFSTPGWEPSLGGFPALSGAVGQFLVKDVVLLGASLWTLGEAWTHQAQVTFPRI